MKGRKIVGIADPSIFDRSRGESIADIMEKEGVYWSPGDNHRIAGKMQYHYRLAFDSNGRAMFYVFDTCKDFIRTIPALVYDEHNVEDIDTTRRIISMMSVVMSLWSTRSPRVRVLSRRYRRRIRRICTNRNVLY